MDYVESAALKGNRPAVASAALVYGGSGGSGAAAAASRGYKRNRPETGAASDDDSLDEYEEDRQPQTEEIMNAQLISQVNPLSSSRSFSVAMMSSRSSNSIRQRKKTPL